MSTMPASPGLVGVSLAGFVALFALVSVDLARASKAQALARYRAMGAPLQEVPMEVSS